MKDANCFLDFITNVYWKSNLVSYHEIKFDHPDPEKSEYVINKQLIYLVGALNLSDPKFDFQKAELFTYGNYEHIEQQYYKFTSFRSQNSYLFVKVDSNFAYGVFTSHGYKRIIFRLGIDFFQNPTMDLIFEEDEGVKEFFDNNSDNDVDMLFATLKTNKAHVKELIIYQLDN